MAETIIYCHPTVLKAAKAALGNLADKLYSQPLPPPVPGTHFGKVGEHVEPGYYIDESGEPWVINRRHGGADREYLAYKRGYKDSSENGDGWDYGYARGYGDGVDAANKSYDKGFEDCLRLHVRIG